nr:hypothetical protein [Fredinandcohnia onubensis]
MKRFMRTEHENQQLTNVLGNQELQQFIEGETGIKIDDDRKLKTPKLSLVTDDSLTFDIEKKENVAYRLNLADYEYYEITDDKSGSVTFSIDQIDLSEKEVVSIDVIDLETSIGFLTDDIRLHLED